MLTVRIHLVMHSTVAVVAGTLGFWVDVSCHTCEFWWAQRMNVRVHSGESSCLMQHMTPIASRAPAAVSKFPREIPQNLPARS